MDYDVVIIGAGPAGISASLYIVRANKKVLVLYGDKSSLEKTDRITVIKVDTITLLSHKK